MKIFGRGIMDDDEVMLGRWRVGCGMMGGKCHADAPVFCPCCCWLSSIVNVGKSIQKQETKNAPRDDAWADREWGHC